MGQKPPYDPEAATVGWLLFPASAGSVTDTVKYEPRIVPSTMTSHEGASETTQGNRVLQGHVGSN
jgi:hypothetical protein